MANHMKDAEVIKALAGLGINIPPKEISPDIQKVLDRLEDYEKEMGQKLDPDILSKYLSS